MLRTEIARRLTLFQHDPWYRGEHRVPIAALADWCGLSRQTIHVARDGEMSEATAENLSEAFALIEDGRIRFLRDGPRWVIEYRTPPNPLPWPQPRLVLKRDWQEWARCRSCGGNRWLPAEIPGAGAHMVCYQCEPPSQWRAFGAMPLKNSVRAAPRRC
jgi:hypothetical protein